MGADQSTPRIEANQEIKTIKIALLGDEKAGKSAILRRLARHNFLEEYVPTETVVVEPITRKIQSDTTGKTDRPSQHKIVSLQLWEIPSQRGDKEGEVTPGLDRFLDNTDGLIVIADLTRESSTALGDTYKRQAERCIGKSLPALLIGTKLDTLKEEGQKNRILKEVLGSATGPEENNHFMARRPTTTAQTQRLLEEWKKLNLGEETVDGVNKLDSLEDQDFISLKAHFEKSSLESDSEEEEDLDNPLIMELKETGKRGEFLHTIGMSAKTDTRKLLQAFDKLIKTICRERINSLEEHAPIGGEDIQPSRLPPSLRMTLTGISESDAYVKEAEELLKEFLLKVSDFNQALKGWKEVCVEKQLTKHAKVSLVDCVINLSEACSFQLKSRPIPDGYGLEEICWPRLEKAGVTAAGREVRRRSTFMASAVASVARQISVNDGQLNEDLDENEEAARQVLVYYQSRVSPAATALQSATFSLEKRLEKLGDRMTICLKQQMELATANGERWTVEGKRGTDPLNANSHGGRGEMDKLKRRNRKNCKVVSNALSLLLFTRKKLTDNSKQIKAALV